MSAVNIGYIAGIIGVIAYSRKQITKEQVEEWCKSLMEKYKNHKEIE